MKRDFHSHFCAAWITTPPFFIVVSPILYLADIVFPGISSQVVRNAVQKRARMAKENAAGGEQPQQAQKVVVEEETLLLLLPGTARAVVVAGGPNTTAR